MYLLSKAIQPKTEQYSQREGVEMPHGDSLDWRESLKAMYFEFFLLGRLSWGTFGALWLWKISQLMIPCAERADAEASGTFTDNSGVLVAAAFRPVHSSTGNVSRASSS